MAEEFNLEKYLTGGVEKIVKEALRATFSNPRESIFMAKYAKSSKEASKKRSEYEKQGEHIPPFLIASITSRCNLHCAGCYSRANEACVDSEPIAQLTGEEWGKIFLEAKSLGIGFILLAGGEPLLRNDVISKAGEIPEILFPIFTNGTLISENNIEIFDKHRNLVPVLSIEGTEKTTDERRGAGIYSRIKNAMDIMKNRNIVFGSSITVTTENINEVTSDEFISFLARGGSKLVIYVEYVPVTGDTEHLAPNDCEREYLKQRLNELRKSCEEMIFISFPGDEKSSGGCLAAGRGFFHINSHGGAEPCPFSPYSDINVKTSSLREALKSNLFTKLRTSGTLMESHSGGCVLFKRRETVKEFMEGKE